MLGIRREEQKIYFGRPENGDLWHMPKYILTLINLYYNIVKIYKYSKIQIFKFYIK